MKKIALTSLLAVFAVSGAHAANVIDGNPLYMPGKNHFYSVTTLGSHTEQGTPYGLSEEFGYGITDKLTVNLQTSVDENNSFDNVSWEGMAFGATYRVLNIGNWKMDLTGNYTVAPVWGDHAAFLDKSETWYGWTAGVRGGYVASNWTVAAKALFEYSNSESFNWNEDVESMHSLIFGLSGQYLVDSKWSVLADVEYMGITDSWAENEGMWNGQFGVNYNIDTTKFVGAYISGSLNHQNGDNYDEWGWEKGFGFGAKFGIDF